MERFQVGDKVVVVDDNMSRAICPAADSTIDDYGFPDGKLRRDVVYHVAAVKEMVSGQGVYITGTRVYWLHCEIPWNWSRFRKVDSIKGHVPMKKKKREPKKAKQARTAPVVVETVR